MYLLMSELVTTIDHVVEQLLWSCGIKLIKIWQIGLPPDLWKSTIAAYNNENLRRRSVSSHRITSATNWRWKLTWIIFSWTCCFSTVASSSKIGFLQLWLLYSLEIESTSQKECLLWMEIFERETLQMIFDRNLHSPPQGWGRQTGQNLGIIFRDGWKQFYIFFDPSILFCILFLKVITIFNPSCILKNFWEVWR